MVFLFIGVLGISWWILELKWEFWDLILERKGCYWGEVGDDGEEVILVNGTFF